MPRTTTKTVLKKATQLQVAIIVLLWLALYALCAFGMIQIQWEVSLAVFVAIPAAVIGVAQIFISSHVQRATYIRDYALRFRTDKELTESFHYLVYRYGNALYAAHSKKDSERTEVEKKELAEAEVGVAADLRFFDPYGAVGAPQERRLDNLLGFFDMLGYDCRRGLLQIGDISGIFGYHLDHLIQRKVIQDYLKHIEKQWPSMSSFHETYSAPVPFRYLRFLMNQYVQFRAQHNKEQSIIIEDEL